MSPLTVFLAKFFGLYCIIVALTMAARKASAIATIRGVIGSPGLLWFVEVIGLAAGLAMIVGHNVWSGGALPVVVTLLGWLMAIRGTVLLALSPEAVARVFEALHYEKYFYVFMGVTLVLGLYLAISGFGA